MERYYNDDSDREQEPFFGDGDNPEDQPQGMEEAGVIEAMQINLAEAQLNQELLDKAIVVASQSWFWRFKSVQKKTADIEAVYQRLWYLMVAATEAEESEE